MVAFEKRIRRAPPRAVDPVRGAEAAARIGASGVLAALLAGSAGCSPYLARLMEREAEWAADAFAGAPEDALAALLAAPVEPSMKQAAVLLRQKKRRAALLIGLADLGGVWDLDTVTAALSAFADHALATSAETALAAERSGPLAGLDATRSGLVVLGMGKLGARELNYSSDVDLICLFDETRFDDDAYQEVKPRFAQVVRRMVKLMSEVDANGYVFRTDLRLRPNPGATAVCVSMDAAETYYESVGRTWERAAFIKARPVAGDLEAGGRFLDTLKPFVFRRHLDFAAIEDAHDMRLKIRAHKRLGERFAIAGHDVKLGLGGIREIEFFAQTQQLVRGGRDASLRDPTTRGALRALVAAGVLSEDVRAALDAAYVAHRNLEHVLQMIEDAQTQNIPTSEAGRARVAALGGWPDCAAFETEVEARCLSVREICDAFFTNEMAGPAPETAEELGALGFTRPAEAARRIDDWMTGRVAATRGERARRRFRALAPQLLPRLAKAASPDDAMAAFDRFMSALPAGAQLFALFEANPHLLDLVTEICAAAPRLAESLGRHSGVLDAVLDRSFFEPVDDGETLAGALSDLLAAEEDYERRLDATRRWARELQFRVGVQTLRGVARADEAGRGFSAVAEACLSALYPAVSAEFARRYGPPPGAGAAVAAMGKLGAREMTATSDLDLIIIYDPLDEEESHGPKQLPVAVYYARLTQALIAAFTAQTAEGALYEVDLRLRPSGRKGPVATRLSSFRRYQAEEAWTWEHMALTRARVVAGDAAMRPGAEAAISEALSRPRDARKVLADARAMREKLAEAHGAERKALWALKQGEGALLDIDLAIQAGLLVTGAEGGRTFGAALGALTESGWLSAARAASLGEARRLMTALQQIERVALDRPFDAASSGEGLRLAMARAAEAHDFDDLEARLAYARRNAAATVETLLAG